MKIAPFREMFGIEEASNIIVDASPYVVARNKQPHGTRTWLFGLNHYPMCADDMNNDKVFEFYGSYTLARQAAIEEAKARGIFLVFVLPGLD